MYFKSDLALFFSTLSDQLKTDLDAGKLALEATPPTAKKIKKTDLSMNKDATTREKNIKQKIAQASFFEASEPSLLWFDRVIFE